MRQRRYIEGHRAMRTDLRDVIHLVQVPKPHALIETKRNLSRIAPQDLPSRQPNFFRRFGSQRGARTPTPDLRQSAHDPEPDIFPLTPRYGRPGAMLVKQGARTHQCALQPRNLNAPRLILGNESTEVNGIGGFIDVDDAILRSGFVRPKDPVTKHANVSGRNAHHANGFRVGSIHDRKAFSQSLRSRLVGRPTPLGWSCWANRIISNFSISSGAVTSRMWSGTNAAPTRLLGNDTTS